MMSETEKQSKISIRKLLPILVIAAIAVAGFFFLKDFLSFEALRDNRELLIGWRDNNYLLVAVGFVLIYFVVVTFSLPGAAIMTLTGGFLFGIFPGVLFNILAASAGAIAIFLAAKTGFGDTLYQKFLAPDDDGETSFIERVEAELRENEISYLFLIRLVPVVPFVIANLVPSFLGVSLRNFALTTVLGIIPGSLVFTSVGAGLGDVFAAGETPDFGIILEPHIIGPILGLAALSALPIVISKFKKGGAK